MTFHFRHLAALVITGAGALSAPLALGQDDAPLSTSDTNVSYIDSALILNRLRLQASAAYDNPTPDRAEFFYPKWGPGAPGPLLQESRVDFQDITMYWESAWTTHFSAFVEGGVRFLNPEQNDNTAGLSDMNFGFKRALWSDAEETLTAELRVYAPTGDADRGLGTDHVSLEPGVLYYAQATDRLMIEAELRLWVPISDSEVNGRNFAGPIVRYGLGFGYNLLSCCECCKCPQRASPQLTAVAEFVGWTVLDGLVFDTDTLVLRSAAGDTIVNGKFGLRWTCGKDSWYVGYGTAMTDDVWYQEIARLEYRYTY